ncbi:hypothetical protein JCM10908_006786 [Rhodotorula pacifica]|uniref:Grh1p n=1 Tax=Rhodotorula pacifica TaxID=1495444 RepID=UPI0031778FE1
MGQAESQPQSGGGGSDASGEGSTHAALHVLRVAENSPAAEAGIEPFFDFVVGAGGQQIGDEIDYLTDVLEQNEGAELPLQIYSTKRKEVREVYVIPSRNWSSAAVPGGEAGMVDGQPSLLGLSLRVCNPQYALDQVWHVLEILEGSPAQSAGLVPFGDWIIGYAGGVLRGEGDFYDVVEAHVDKPLRLFVYNSDYDVTREAILVPNRSWGGEGLLGCGVGYGLLHRIPKPQDRVEPPPHPDPPRTDAPLPAAPPPGPETSRRFSGFSSVSSNVPPAQNPLYAPPPPRAGAPTPPRPNQQSQAPPPPRRTAALVSPEEARDSRNKSPPQQQRAPPGPRYAPPPPGPPPRTSSDRQHPSFSQYDRPSNGPRFGEYDASDGVEVVAVEVEPEPARVVSPTRPPPPGGPNSYRKTSGGRGMGPVYAQPPPPPPPLQAGRTSSDRGARQPARV